MVSMGTNVVNTTDPPQVVLSNNIVGQEGSLMSVCDPVGAHVPVTTEEKVWKGEFIELATLLPDQGIKQSKEQ